MRRKRFNIKGLQEYPVSAVRVHNLNGKRYVYHRASGAPLPDLGFDDPAFVAAFLQAETEHRNATASPEERLRARPVPTGIEFEPPVSPDAITFTTTQIIAWVHGAKAGHVCYYHFGSLVADGPADSVTEKRNYVAMLRSFGAVELRQRRVSDAMTHYYAIRTDESLRLMPRNAITGAVSAQEYFAVHALSERQSSMSVARTIRDSLGISEDAACQMRNDLIRRGWLSNTRPPQLTELGLSVLV